VIVATEGTLIHPVNGEPVKIKKSKIRGVVSEGMICAEDEIGISNDHTGVLVFAAGAVEGMWAKDFMKIETDHIFEVAITANRGDAMSHIALREIFMPAACIRGFIRYA
jgi:phenylalanyl-tRNA synthetase beta chain